jgi:hypothetical protein
MVGRRDDTVYIATANHLLRREARTASAVRISFRMDPDRAFPARVLPLTEPGLDVGVLGVTGFEHLGVPFCSLP